MAEQFVSGFLATKLGDTTRDYQQWKAQVRSVRDLPEYKMRKLWKLNYSVRDIAADRHWEIFPPAQAQRQARGRDHSEKRGAKIGAQRKSYLYAKALCQVARTLLTFHSLEPGVRAETQKELEQFEELVKKYTCHKPKKDLTK